MTQARTIAKLQRQWRRQLEHLLKQSYQEGVEAGLARAHGLGRRGRTIRADTKVEGLVRLIEQHFSLDRYSFEVRIVHGKSGRRLPAEDLIRKYRLGED